MLHPQLFLYAALLLLRNISPLEAQSQVIDTVSSLSRDLQARIQQEYSTSQLRLVISI